VFFFYTYTGFREPDQCRFGTLLDPRIPQYHFRADENNILMGPRGPTTEWHIRIGIFPFTDGIFELQLLLSHPVAGLRGPGSCYAVTQVLALFARLPGSESGMGPVLDTWRTFTSWAR